MRRSILSLPTWLDNARGAKNLRDLDSEPPCNSGRAQDQYGLTRPQPGPMTEGKPGRDAIGNSRRRSVVEIIRNRKALFEPDDRAFREGAIRPTWSAKEHTRSAGEAADSVGSANHRKFSRARELRTRSELFVDGFEGSC